MPFPKRPRGEKPAVTIRWQRRQMATMEARIAILTRELSSKTALAAELDRRCSEMPMHFTSMHAMAAELDDANATIDRLSVEKRLAYLEGYFYAKEKEAGVQQTAVFPASRTIPSHQSHFDAGPGPGNPQSVQDGRQATESAGFDPGAAGFGETSGDKIPSERADYRSHPSKRSVEYVEITEARDGLTKWAEDDRLW